MDIPVATSSDASDSEGSSGTDDGGGNCIETPDASLWMLCPHRACWPGESRASRVRLVRVSSGRCASVVTKRRPWLDVVLFIQRPLVADASSL